MYKDELWYRQLIREIEVHQSNFTAKQLRAYQVNFMLRIALRIKDYSDACETCRDFQRTLSRMEEELPELLNSKAQRHYQAQQLRLITDHFVRAHRLAPPYYYTRLYVNYGLVVGLFLGIVVGLLALNNGIYLPLGLVAGVILGAAYGSCMDARVKRQQRVL